MRSAVTKDDLKVLTEADRKQIRKSIYSARAKERPPLPQTLAELHDTNMSVDVTTKLDEPFLLANDDENNNIPMFSTSKNCKFLVFTCDVLLLDGTFYSTPKLFKH